MKTLFVFIILMICVPLAHANPDDQIAPTPEAKTVAGIMSAVEKAIMIIPDRHQLPAQVSGTLVIRDNIISAQSLVERGGDMSGSLASMGTLMSFAGRLFSEVGSSVPLPPDVSARIWTKVARLAEDRAWASDVSGSTCRALIWNGISDVALGAAAASRFAANSGRTLISVIGDVTDNVGDAAKFAGKYLSQ